MIVQLNQILARNLVFAGALAFAYSLQARVDFVDALSNLHKVKRKVSLVSVK